jgi:hypothetical protein
MHAAEPSPVSDEVWSRLTRLLRDLYADTNGFLDRSDDAQSWYDRGYANGLAAALVELGEGARLDGCVVLDPPEVAVEQRVLPWGKAYAHGFEKGHDETIAMMERLRGV